MKALFIYDGPIHKNKKGQYCSTLYTYDWFTRYLELANNLTVCMFTRRLAKKEENTVPVLDCDAIKIVEAPTLSTVGGALTQRKRARKILIHFIRKSSLIIIRLPSFLGYMAVDICEKMKKKYLVEVVGCPWDAYWNHSLKGKVVAPYAAIRLKQCMRKAPYSIYVTEKFLQKRYPTKGKSIACSDVLLEEQEDEILENRIRRINNHSGKYIIGTAAAIDVKYKGQQYVIEALGNLKKMGNVKFEYQVVGSGSGEYLKKIAKEHNVTEQVKIMGVMSHEEVLQWLNNIDFYIQPSLQEGLPRALVEAMSKALPALGTNTGGIPELLEDNFIVSRKKKKIAGSITNLLLQWNNNSMIEQSRKNFQRSKDFSLEYLVEKRKHFMEQYKYEARKRK